MKHLWLLLLLSSCWAPPPTPAEQRPIVFMGDSITHLWPLPEFRVRLINAGTRGGTTKQMFKRFRRDVINQAPQAVVILGGTNDIELGLQDGIENIRAMVALARRSGIRVILCALTPRTNFNAEVLIFNAALRAMAREESVTVVDYYQAMLTPHGEPDAALFVDGLHPSPAGYAIMWSLVSAAITPPTPGTSTASRRS